MDTDVFISYDHDDAETVRKLEAALSQKYKVWRDERAANGTLWRPQIDVKLQEAKLLVVIISSASMQSAYVTYEWCYAWLHLKKHLRKEIYWIYLETPPLDKGMFGRLLDFQLSLEKPLKGSSTQDDDWKSIINDIETRLEEFSVVENAGARLLISGSERDALRGNYRLRNHQIQAVNELGEIKQHTSRARDYLHQGIQILLSGDPDGVVMESIARALSKVGDLSSVPYLWLAYNSPQVLEYQPARQALYDVLTHLSSCLYDCE